MFPSFGQRRHPPRNTRVVSDTALAWYRPVGPDGSSREVTRYTGPTLRERVHDYMDAMRDLHEEVPPGAPPDGSGEIPADRYDEPVAMDIPHFEEPWYQRVGRNVKRAMLKCFCLGELAECWDREVAMSAAIRQEMMTTFVPDEGRTVQEQVVADVERLNAHKVKHIPRLVVEVVVALRCKLGMGAQDRSIPGNVSVVRAEAAKMLRDWNVRAKDAAAHLVEIERCFFEDDSHYRVTTWRARGVRNSRFFRWFIGKNEPVGFDY